MDRPERRSGSADAADGRLQNIAVISGRYPATEFASAPNHRAYCGAHGYTYVHCNWPTGQQNPYLNKIEYVLYHFELFDWIFWIDDDAFFLDLGRSLEHLMPPPDKFLSVCSSPAHKKLKTPISSGQFLIRTDETGRRFLETVLATDLEMVRDWWTDDLGYFSGGDQDAMVHAMRTVPEFSDGIEVFPAEVFNSRIDDVVAGSPVFLLHFTGPRWAKRSDAKRAARHLGRGLELLTPSEAESIGVVDQPSWLVKEAWDWRTRAVRFGRRLRSGRR